MPRAVVATYRLQLSPEFPLARARALVPYLHRLGVSHLYLSPLLAARPGSPHGYDVVDHGRINPELGSEEELGALAADLHARQMGIILDIVPNHMAAAAENAAWDDVLARGRASRFGDWFDIDWDAPNAHGKIVLPILGDEVDRVLERNELSVRVRDSGTRLVYFERTLPLDPTTLPTELQLAQLDPAARPAADAWQAGEEGRARLRRLIEQQHYRLRFWRRGQSEINYRRFFDVTDLVALRVETDAVFDATHALILRWVRDGIVDGVRVDHVDGLYAPTWYLGKLRAAMDAPRDADAPERAPIYVEKILAPGESLPADWPVDGTTGYDFMRDVEELFLETEGYAAIEASYRRLRKNPALTFDAVAGDAKRRALRGALRPDVLRVARIAHAWRGEVSVDDYADAMVHLIAGLEVYRTYLVAPGLVNDVDRRWLTHAFGAARGSAEASTAALSLLERAFFAPPDAGDALRTELVMRFQQTSGPAAAKGVEDTALYSYTPLASRNEVGGAPGEPLDGAHQRLHARNAARLRDWPASLLAANTHDTKRSADLRARLDALTAMPDVWSRHVARWRRLSRPHKRVVSGKPAPDTNSEYLYYQTLLGLWPAPRPQRRVDDLPDRAWLERTRARLVAYMLKAAREAKTRTSWTERDREFEAALDAFVRGTLEPREDAPFLGDVARLTALTADIGFRVSLARVLLQCTSPGTPDIYQGDELWTFSLVDPDNRQTVDFDRRAQLLASSVEGDGGALLRDVLAGRGHLADDRAKLAFLARVLAFRRDHARLLRRGDYLPLLVGPRDGRRESTAFLFARKLDREVCIVAARTRSNESDDTTASVALSVDLAGRWKSVLTGRVIDTERATHQLGIGLHQLLPPPQPCELLLRTST